MHKDMPGRINRGTYPNADYSSASFVHDLGNYLQIAISALHIISRHSNRDEPDSIAQISARAMDALERAGTMLRQRVRATDSVGHEETDIRACLDQLRPLLEHVCGTAIDLRIDIGLVPRAQCAAAVLEALLLNLALNARDAMPGGGALTVRAQVTQGPENPEIEIVVIDTGIGMSPDVLSRAVDKHFTTKGGEGSRGIGLSGVKHNVERQGGRLAIASKVGIGTSVTIRLPVALLPLPG